MPLRTNAAILRSSRGASGRTTTRANARTKIAQPERSPCGLRHVRLGLAGMTSRLCLIVCLAALALVGAASSADASNNGRDPAMATVAALHCRDVGPPNSDVGLYQVTATRLSCSQARSVLRRWYNNPSAPRSGPRGWRCWTRQTSAFAYRTTCRRKGATIRFTQLAA